MLRIIEILVSSRHEKVQELLGDYPILDIQYEEIARDRNRIRILLSLGKTQPVLDILREHFSQEKGFRITVIPVEATIPSPQQSGEENSPEQKKKARNSDTGKKSARKISREEVYEDLEDSSHVSKIFIILVMLSSLIAAIGIRADDTITIIAGMIIAPLLGPNVALALATVIGDIDLGKAAIKTVAVGSGVSVLIAVIIGSIFSADPGSQQIVNLTRVTIRDVILSLASGAAGALAFTTGIGTTLTGVLMAVALLPPIVSIGLLLGAGYTGLAANSLILALTNLIGINLAGVVTFLLQGLRSQSGGGGEKAKTTVPAALLLWLILLTGVFAFIFFSKQ